MKTNVTSTSFSVSKRIKVATVWCALSFLLGNCYFNPAVNSLLDPKEAEKNSPASFLALAAGGGSGPSLATALIAGQLKDASDNGIAGASLDVSGTNSSTREMFIVSTSVKTDSLGKFVLFLRSGNTSFQVTDSNGNPLGGFTLSVADNNQSATFQSDASATFTVTLISVIPSEGITTTGGGGGDTTPPTLVSSNPANGSNTHLHYDPITLTFSEDITSANINSAISFTPVISFSASISGSVVTINATMSSKQAYTIDINSGITDLAGNPLSPTTVNFITTMPP
ncbi:Ig-like domain-containing protein [Leptospira idonii]|uniref:SbsA Ig-like domain-containing protein n=1 Tax=Leptospira idonii TaxID=1193500 RepID=A0A4R9LX37_9LEPT|nr:Ig-like domain-containing protein [Leptospira idonii]TGN18863.1 hypothetical protein EHS15_10595 [Leptospira idonii]